MSPKAPATSDLNHLPAMSTFPHRHLAAGRRAIHIEAKSSQIEASLQSRLWVNRVGLTLFGHFQFASNMYISPAPATLTASAPTRTEFVAV